MQPCAAYWSPFCLLVLGPAMLAQKFGVLPSVQLTEEPAVVSNGPSGSLPNRLHGLPMGTGPA